MQLQEIYNQEADEEDEMVDQHKPATAQGSKDKTQKPPKDEKKESKPSFFDRNLSLSVRVRIISG
jgi:hypothetical protein